MTNGCLHHTRYGQKQSIIFDEICKHNVTYSGFSVHDGTLLHSRSQYTTVKHSQQLLEHTYASDPHGLEHSLQFLQSESFQTQVGTIYRRAIGPLAHYNGTLAYSPSLTCRLPAPTIGCLHRPP
jgi:hypothetical protein